MALPGHIKSHENKAVTPAKAGVQWLSGDEEPAPDLIRGHWIPAPVQAGGRLCAGMTLWGTEQVYFHRNFPWPVARPHQEP